MPTSARIATIRRIQDIYDKLNSKALVAEELEELVKLTSDLYASAVILRYKAAEEKVFDQPEVTADEELEEPEPEISVEPIPAPEAIDFSIFDAPNEEIPEVIPELAIETEVEPKLDFSPIEEEPLEVEEPVAEKIIETVAVEEEIQEEIVPESTEEHSSNAAKWKKYFERVLKEHDSGMKTPLSALAGSFGLNERILYINELFDREAEAFSEVIQKMDGLSDWNACAAELANQADARTWDNDSDTTGEFILHIRRRYA